MTKPSFWKAHDQQVAAFGLRTCPRCKGAGSFHTGALSGPTEISCTKCKGTGEIERKPS